MRLDIYDNYPSGMREYLRSYGYHFSKKMCEFAVSKMKVRNQQTGQKEPLATWDKEKVDALLEKYGIKLQNKIAYDYVFVCNMGRADYLLSSIPNEQYLAKYIQDVVDDPDGYKELPFNRYYADTIGLGIPIIWEDMI